MIHRGAANKSRHLATNGLMRQLKMQNQHPSSTLFRWSIWLMTANICFFWIIGCRYINSSLLTTEFLLQLPIAMGQLALLAIFPTLVLTLPLNTFFPNSQRSIAIASSLFNSTVLTLLLIDTMVYEQYGFHMSWTFLLMFLDPFGQQIFHFTWLEYTCLGVLVALIFSIEMKLSNFIWRHLCEKSCRPPLIFIAICLFTSLLTYGTHYFITTKKPLAHIDFTLPNSTTPLNYPLHPLTCTAPKQPLNLVMIVIDAWRFDMLNNAVTPHLLQFAKHSWQFTQHRSGGNATQPGIFSLFYGLPANYWDATLTQKQGPVLIDTLLRQHYQTGIFASAALSIPNFRANVFSALNDLPAVTAGKNVYERDVTITKTFQQFIQTTQQPFFAFLFYDAAHNYCENGNPVAAFQPITQTCNRMTLNNASNPALHFNRYKNSLYFIDTLINQVLQQLKQQGLLDNTVILITGDHGNEFNDNRLGYWGHDSNFTRYQVQTPLIIYWPKKMAAHFDYPTNHYDIVATLLPNLLGCHNPSSDYSIGHSLLTSHPQNYLLVHSYTNFGIIEPARITYFSPNGDYQIDNIENQPLPNAILDLEVFQQTLQDMKRYFTYDK